MVKFYQVGGSVRDELLGLKSKDIDYAVEADSFEAMREAIVERGGTIFLETPKYLTIRAKVPGLGACDYVLCRKDGAYSDGRRPDKVDVGTIYDDLARRDFTMNAIAKDEEGNYFDPFNGMNHIVSRFIQCVGNTEGRFTEDGLRMLRAIRFKITKGFTISMDIERFLRDKSFIEAYLGGVSVERIREELIRCFRHDTNETFETLGKYPHLRYHIFKDGVLWLKPTLEPR